MRIALIGLGRMGRQHFAALRVRSSAQIVALYDPALSGDVEGCPVRGFDEVLSDPSITGVLIAAPTDRHETLVTRALEAGKHVLCEKPLTLDPGADLALGAMAAERGLIIAVGFWRRFAEPYLVLTNLISEGVIGPVAALRLAQWDAVPPPPEFCDLSVSGGLEVDCGVHELDLIRYLLGTGIESIATLAAPPSESLAKTGDIETMSALARCGKGAVATIDLTRTAGGRDLIRTEAIGQRGSVVTEIIANASQTLRTPDGKVIESRFAGDVIADALCAQFDAFAEAVASGHPGPAMAGAKEAAWALAAGRALQRSRTSGGEWSAVNLSGLRDAMPC